MQCALCQVEHDESELDRVSGVSLCVTCRGTDPTALLKQQGIAAEWSQSLGYFSAGLSVPGAVPDFYLSCSPELLHHKAIKLVVTEVQVDDPWFDDAIYVRTNDRGRAREVLGSEGVQAALLGVLQGNRVEDALSNHVTLDGETLTVRVKPESGLGAEKVQELKIELAALVLQLKV